MLYALHGLDALHEVGWGMQLVLGFFMVAGLIHDATGSYRTAFLLAIGCSLVSAGAIWLAAPRKVRLVPGRARGEGR